MIQIINIDWKLNLGESLALLIYLLWRRLLRLLTLIVLQDQLLYRLCLCHSLGILIRVNYCDTTIFMEDIKSKCRLKQRHIYQANGKRAISKLIIGRLMSQLIMLVL